LIKLPAAERAELAITLWDSLSDAERDAEFVLTPEQATELDRRWAAHLDDPSSAIPWAAVRRRLQSNR
jgi:putative addiction module component (TIGR02574 family)